MQRLARSLNLKSPANAFPFNLRAPALSALASLLVIGVGMGGVAWSADNEADPSSQAVAVQDEGRADELEVGTRRILAALEAGTINSDQAYERLMGLRKRETARRNEDVRRRRAEYARVEKELMAAVKAGRVKEEDAKRRLGEMREHMFPNASGGDEKVVPNPREEYARVEKELKAMVEADKISAEDARRRLSGFRESLGSEDVRRRRAEYARVEEKLMAAVKVGRISEEDAKRRLGEMRARMFPTASGGDEKAVRIPREEYKRVQKELKAMVEAGKISEEDALRRLSGFRVRPDRGAGDKPAADGDRDAKLKRMYDGFERRIKAAVAKGDMTREEAAEKLKAFKERLSSRRGSREGKGGDGGDRTRGDAEKSDSDRANSDVDKIYAAVRAGELSREEAGKKLRALKSKKASGDRKGKKESRGRGDGATTPTRDF
jgi:hypothetical protein